MISPQCHSPLIFPHTLLLRARTLRCVFEIRSATSLPIKFMFNIKSMAGDIAEKRSNSCLIQNSIRNVPATYFRVLIYNAWQVTLRRKVHSPFGSPQCHSPIIFPHTLLLQARTLRCVFEIRSETSLPLNFVFSFIMHGR